ncbi:hypothetical protein Efla_007735 [Eimeria flavescens]
MVWEIWKNAQGLYIGSTNPPMRLQVDVSTLDESGCWLVDTVPMNGRGASVKLPHEYAMLRSVCSKDEELLETYGKLIPVLCSIKFWLKSYAASQHSAEDKMSRIYCYRLITDDGCQLIQGRSCGLTCRTRERQLGVANGQTVGCSTTQLVLHAFLCERSHPTSSAARGVQPDSIRFCADAHPLTTTARQGGCKPSDRTFAISLEESVTYGIIA